MSSIIGSRKDVSWALRRRLPKQQGLAAVGRLDVSAELPRLGVGGAARRSRRDRGLEPATRPGTVESRQWGTAQPQAPSTADPALVRWPGPVRFGSVRAAHAGSSPPLQPDPLPGRPAHSRRQRTARCRATAGPGTAAGRCGTPAPPSPTTPAARAAPAAARRAQPRRPPSPPTPRHASLPEDLTWAPHVPPPATTSNTKAPVWVRPRARTLYRCGAGGAKPSESLPGRKERTAVQPPAAPRVTCRDACRCLREGPTKRRPFTRLPAWCVFSPTWTVPKRGG